ncbi:MAG: DUF2339 domain-containing protein [Kiritimatiellae bacterium]|nr:DUF2339 domain-containing protein [Kiritimatiellia bacterium]
MEMLLAIHVLPIAVGLLVMVICVLVKLGTLRREIADLKRKLDLRWMPEEREDVEKEREEEPEAVGMAAASAPEPIVECQPPDAVVDEPPPAAPDDGPSDDPHPVPDAPQPPTAMEVFWMKVGDWFAVRGAFAPEGVTHEFAFATRWLVRVGAVLLIGAIAYFLMLAVDRGWIGPVQRVYGMMAWGVVGTVFGTWLKRRSERYAILGEVCVALGLAAAYLSFGLGHRYFNPPVIASGGVAFAGLSTATFAAGVLSVRLRSLMTACLALVGGFLVPVICSFASHDVQLHVYLLLLSLGACAVAYFRGWAIYAFAALAAAFAFSQVKCGSCANCDVAASYLFHALGLALALATAVRASVRGGHAKMRPFYWLPAVLAGAFCLCKMDAIVRAHFAWRGACALGHFGWATVFAALAFFSRRRNWGGTPALIALSCACAVFALGSACIGWWRLNSAAIALLFCLFAALLAEFGTRSGERSLQAIALIATAVMPYAGFCLFVAAAVKGDGGYAQNLVDRIQYLWPVPALVAFAAWRIGKDAFWRRVLLLRSWAYAVAAAMAFVVVTEESHFFGKEYLPALRGGFVTVVWAVTASAALAAGIVRRIRVTRLVGLGILALSVLKLLLLDTASLATPGRVGVFAAVGALLIAGAFLYLKFKPLFEAEGGVK